MRLLIFLILPILLSCGSAETETEKQITQSDSLVINFNTPGSNTIEKTLTTIEKKAIRKLAGYINTKTAAAFKCGYDGNILFFTKGRLTGDVSFNYTGEGCRHFIQTIKDQLSPTTMSIEAADFLKSLAEGKNWY